MGMTERIEALELVMAPIEWEPCELRMYVQDCSIPGDGTPDRLSMILHSGTPTRPGRKYYRTETETEEGFLERIKAAEVVKSCHSE